MNNLQIAQLVDKGGLVLWYLIPSILILLIKGKRGILVGALSFWLTGLALGVTLARLDPQREGGLIDAIFLFTGWLAGLIYSTIMFLMKQGLLFVWHRLQRPIKV